MELVDSIVVARPSRQVFDFITDYANDPAWREGVLVMRADGPAIAGTNTHEELEFLGSRYVTKGVVTERSDTRMAFRGESLDQTRGRPTVLSEGFREVVPAEGGTSQVTYRLGLELRGALAIFAPLLRPLYARRIARDLVRLKALLERVREG
ncbi:MAG: hypothetical protein K0S65_5540 [Labilithrix sp.]|nr:hypothetical protein [Labilithrix sp.]